MTDRTYRGLLIAALLVALGLRLFGVTESALTQWDEGPYAGATMDKGPSVREDPRIVYAPPLFPAMCGALYRIFGEDPRYAIGLAGVLGALQVLAAAWLARLLFGALAGVFAASILAVEPLSVAHSRLALTESTFTLLTLVALALAIRTLRSRKVSDAALLGLAAGLTTLTKFHGFLPLVVFLVVAAWDGLHALSVGGEDRTSRLREHARSGIVAGLVALPFGLFVLRDITDVMTLAAFSESRTTWVEGLHSYTITGTARFAADAIRELGAIGTALLGVIGAALALRRSRSAELWIVFGYAAILALTLITYQNYARLFVPALALLAVFGGSALSSLATSAGRSGRRLAWITLAITAATGVPALQDALRFRGHGYPDMARQIEARLIDAPGPILAVAQQSLFPYLSRAACDNVWWITEVTGQAMVEDASFRYLITDLDFERHARVRPHVDRFASRLELVAEIPNPLPRAVLFDRLGPAALRRFDADPKSEEFQNATRLRLFELRAP